MNISKINNITFAGRKAPKKIAKVTDIKLSKNTADTLHISSTKPKDKMPTPPKPPESRTIIESYITPFMLK